MEKNINKCREEVELAYIPPLDIIKSQVKNRITELLSPYEIMCASSKAIATDQDDEKKKKKL